MTKQQRLARIKVLQELYDELKANEKEANEHQRYATATEIQNAAFHVWVKMRQERCATA